MHTMILMLVELSLFLVGRRLVRLLRWFGWDGPEFRESTTVKIGFFATVLMWVALALLIAQL